MNTLPTNWYIEVTRENQEELNRWRKKVATQYRDYTVRAGYTLLSRHQYDGSYYYSDGADVVRDCDEYKDYQEITLEQFRAITNPLPEHWYIEVTEDNREELNRWRLSKRTIDAARWDHKFVPGATLLSKHPQNDGSYFWSKEAETPIELKHPQYKPITLEQFRQITNSKPMSKPEVKTIQISRTLLNQYYEAATPPQKEYIVNHFKMDGTTTDEAIRGLHEKACSEWKPKIKANHPDCFPEDSKYFDFSKYDSHLIMIPDAIKALGFGRNSDPIQIRVGVDSTYQHKGFWLDDNYDWELVRDNLNALVLVPTKKVK
jgi:hypothetical protein